MISLVKSARNVRNMKSTVRNMKSTVRNMKCSPQVNRASI